MQNIAIRAVATNGFRLTLDLSAWGAVGIRLAGAILRMQAWESLRGSPNAPAIEFATNSANPVMFDPDSGLAVFVAPATATHALGGVYAYAARAEFSGYELPLFAGAINFQPGVLHSSPSASPPAFETAWVAAHPFGPAPVPAPLVAAVAAAQMGIGEAIVRAILFGG